MEIPTHIGNLKIFLKEIVLIETYFYQKIEFKSEREIVNEKRIT